MGTRTDQAVIITDKRLMKSVGFGLTALLLFQIFAPRALPSSFSIEDVEGSEVARGSEVKSQSADVETRRIEYRRPNGVLALQETISTKITDGLLLAFSAEDFESGETTKITREGDKLELKRRSSREHAETDSTVHWSPEVLVGAQIGDFLLRNFHLLEKGDDLRFEILVPHMGMSFAYDAQTEEVNGSAKDKTPRNSVVVICKPANWLIRAFAPSFSFRIEKEKERRALLEYQGPSAVTVSGVAHAPVRIQFKTPQL